MLSVRPIQYYIPWRVVWKLCSVSTPTRMVFDATVPTATGYSLNSVLPKGKTTLNKLVEIYLRWFIYKIGFHADIKKMYNSIQLRKQDWTYQRYIFQPELDKKKIPHEKVIKTLIYGVRPSGNQAEHALRETAKLSKDLYPDVYRIVYKDTYVDDCLSGGENHDEVSKFADDMETVRNSGGFSLKCVTFSGFNPPESISSDGTSINVAGMRWYPCDDTLAFDLGKLNFSRRRRGKKSDESNDVIPGNFTRRDCVSRVSQLFDISGKATPITATRKLDLHELIVRQLDWDDKVTLFVMMNEINDPRYRRAVIPDDTVSANLETLDFADASQRLCCIAIYARFLRKCGNYSCQLIFGRSKIVPEGTSQPRVELMAATVNVHAGSVVKRSLGKFYQSSLKITDI